jgi:hypothetical protein
MKPIGMTISTLLVLLCSLFGQAQQSVVATNTSVTVPPLVNFSGTLNDANGKPLSGTVAVTFLLYKESQGGSPLWLETQNVQPDNTGHYTVMLGSTSSTGLPSDIFIAGEAHWLGVQVQGQSQEEQPRVLLVSAPYALKAGDAETIGGLPPSAFVLAAPATASSTSMPTAFARSASPADAPAGTDVTGSGTADFIPLWTTTSNIGNSVLFQSGSGATAKVGINTKTPGATLDVRGAANVEGLLTLPATGAATSSGGRVSQGQEFVASSYNSGTAAAVNQTFELRAEPAGNDTASPSGTLSLLFGSGTTSPAETGLKIASDGRFTFATGQTFPGTGTITGVTTASGSGLTGGGTSGTLNLGLKTCSASQVLQYVSGAWTCSNAGTGTITGVTAGTDLTGGGTSGSVTLNLDTTKVPLLSAANTFVGNQSITGNLTATGSISAQTASLNANGTTTALLVNQSGGGVGLGVSATTGNGISSIAEFIGVEGASTAAGGYGVAGLSTSGYAVYGVDNAPTGASVGVYGETQSSAGYGVEGSASNVGVYGSGTGTVGYGVDGHGTYIGVKGVGTGTSGTSIGVYGQTADSEGFGVQGASPYVGVYGAAAGSSQTGAGYIPDAGVWGDTGGNDFAGVYGTADNNWAGLFYNNGSVPTLEAYNETSGNGLVFETIASDFENEFTCTIDTGANLTCSGTIKGVANVEGGARKVSLYAMQSAENWFEDAGSGQLSNGSTSIALDPTFAQTVNLGVDYHVFLTPNGDCKGLYVSQKSATSFEVHELGGGNSSVAFDYRIMAKRSGYENARLADVTEQYQKMEQQDRLRQQRMHQHRAARSTEGPIAAVAPAPDKPTVEAVARTAPARK